jgi:hypothetical protein
MSKRLRQPATPQQKALTVPQYAEEYGLSERAAWMEVHRGLIPHKRHGRKVLIFRDELDAFRKALPGVSVEEAAEKAAARVA